MDQHVLFVGKDCNGPGTFTRSGSNTAQVCQEFHSNCYGGAHANGEPLMGAIWDIDQAIGPGPQGMGFDDPADVILVSWIQLFGGAMAQVSGVIREELRDEWLLLDDYSVSSPASLFGSGSPHFTEINDGFEGHGWPPFVDSLFSVDHLPIASHGQAGPVTIAATVTPSGAFVGGPTGSIPPVVSTVRVVGQQNGQAFNYQMALVPGTSDEFEYTLPQIPNNFDVVKYWFEIEDATGYSQHYPPGGGAFSYMVGEFTPYYSFDFESSGMHGWTTAADPGAASQNVFELGSPVGRAGANPPWGDNWFDPSGAASGEKAWGNDLGLGAFDGAYSDGEHCFLYSPAFLLDPAVDAVRLEYSRFLSLNLTDGASVYLENVGSGAGNGQMTSLVAIPAGRSVNIQDGAWIRVSGNASIPGHNPGVATDNEFRIVFELESSASRPSGGWTIDDIDMFKLSAASGPTGQNDVMLLANTVASVGDQLRARVDAGVAHAGTSFAVLWSSSLGSGTYSGYTTELSSPSLAASGALGASGAIEVQLPAVPTPPNLPTTYYIEAVVYDSGRAIVADSNVIEILVE